MTLPNPVPAAGWEAGPVLVETNARAPQFSEEHLATLSNGNVVVSSLVYPGGSFSDREYIITVLSPTGDLITRKEIFPASAPDADGIPASVVALPDGGFAAIWTNELFEGPERQQVLVQFFNDNGVETSGVSRVTGTNDYDDFSTFPFSDRPLTSESLDVEVLSNGNIAIVTSVLQDDAETPGPFFNNYDEYVTIFDQAGNNVANITVEEGGPSAGQLRLAATHDGGFLAVWSESTGSLSVPGSVSTTGFARLYDAAGQPQGPRVDLGKQVNGDHEIIKLSDGGFVIPRIGTSNDLTLQILNSDLSERTPETVVLESGPNGTYNLAAFSDNTFIVAWSEVEGSNKVHYIQRYDSDGALLGDQFEAGRSDPSNRFGNNKPEVVATEDGQVTMFWQEADNTNTTEYYVQKFNFPIGLFTAGDDNVIGGSDNDDFDALSGDDTVAGGNGRDKIDGASGNDVLFGDKGKDRLIGGEDDDSLFGGGQDDKLFGKRGEDFLSGERGDDELTGGGAADVFFLRAATEGGNDPNQVDVIKDLDVGEGDLIALEGYDEASLAITAVTGGFLLNAVEDKSGLAENIVLIETSGGLSATDIEAAVRFVADQTEAEMLL
ncbi:MAG: calcium-binding protein [Pseudomonadota bacterium]